MSSKRKISDVDGDTSGPNNKRKSQNRTQFRRDQDPPTTTNGSNNKIHNKIQEGRINSLKKRVRAIERLFNSGKDLPANVQNDMERELAHHKQKIIDLKADKQRRVMIKKYHMVRFFGTSSYTSFCLFVCVERVLTNSIHHQSGKRRIDLRSRSGDSSRTPRMRRKSGGSRLTCTLPRSTVYTRGISPTGSRTSAYTPSRARERSRKTRVRQRRR